MLWKRSINTVEVHRTEMRISSALHVQVRNGAKEVSLREDLGSSNHKTEYVQTKHHINNYLNKFRKNR